MERTDENVTLCAEALMALAHLRNAPINLQGWRSVSRCVCDFVENQEKLEWLVDKIQFDNDGRFPPVSEMRATYANRFIPADELKK